MALKAREPRDGLVLLGRILNIYGLLKISLHLMRGNNLEILHPCETKSNNNGASIKKKKGI